MSLAVLAISAISSSGKGHGVSILRDPTLMPSSLAF